MPNQSFPFQGYSFDNEKEASLAQHEYKNIQTIKNKIDMNSKDNILLIYNKTVSRNLFKTPIGIAFLKELRDCLTEQYHVSEPELAKIPVPTFSNKPVTKEERDIDSMQKEITKLKHVKGKLKIAVVILVAMIGCMFYITATNKNTGFINAEEKVLNKYSSWEDQLNKKEQELKEREAKLEDSQK